MDAVEGLDWELLQTNSDSESAPVSSLDEIDSGGLIQANYFSLDRCGEGVDDEESAGSDNPSWIDPGSEDGPIRFLNKEPGEFWSDSSSERSEDRKFSELEGTKELYLPENEKQEVKFEGIGDGHDGKGKEAEDLMKSYMDSSGIGTPSAQLSQHSDSAENSHMDVEGNLNLHVVSEVLGEEKNENEKHVSGQNKRSGELEKKTIVWWKMPMEFLKYCVFRMNPVWTVSVAAAFMGFVILGRRLYKMKKKKTRGLEIKVTVDDKKVSQVMSRAARLNEAFSVVKRVPLIRPSLPAVGSSSTWPAMSIRSA